MRHWYYVETQEHGPFSVKIDWTYEHAALGDCFDETVCDLEDMIDRCNRGIDTHYIARVTAFYKGTELASTTLGSCYAVDCHPEQDIGSGIAGYLEDMIAEVLDEARKRALEMKKSLEADFAEIK